MAPAGDAEGVFHWLGARSRELSVQKNSDANLCCIQHLEFHRMFRRHRFSDFLALPDYHALAPEFPIILPLENRTQFFRKLWPNWFCVMGARAAFVAGEHQLKVKLDTRLGSGRAIGNDGCEQEGKTKKDDAHNRKGLTFVSLTCHRVNAFNKFASDVKFVSQMKLLDV